MALGKKTGGRKKGSLNKANADARAMIDGALKQLGGQDWLVEAAEKQPAAFMALIGKTLPRDVNMNLEIALSDRMRALLDRNTVE